MKKYAGYKVRKIVENNFDARVELMVVTYILSKGWDVIKEITDEEIERMDGNSMMTKNFVQSLVRTARNICQECTINEDFLPYVINYLYVEKAPVKEIHLFDEDFRKDAWQDLILCFERQIGDDVDIDDISHLCLNATLLDSTRRI